jgi:phosphatidylserine/phosphatidylglycerophosphate/cardiolipin synthase-like enzyme
MAIAAAMQGCASLPPPQELPPTKALADPSSTQLAQLVKRHAPSSEVSGFRLLVSGEEALGAFAALAEKAQKTLDLQYYIVRSDPSGRALMRKVREAADRGVRVRLLLDDFNTSGQDAGLLRFTKHPNIEVRLYNPFPGRGATVNRLLASLSDFSRINQRMHNKMFVADNSLAITGGRNIGDAYFLRDQKSNFLDLDILVAGPAVRRLSATFDAFWNAPLAYPVAAIVDEPPYEDPAIAAAAPKPEIAPIPDTEIGRELQRNQLKLTWAQASLLADKPSKIESKGDPTATETIADDVESLIRSARSEVLLISPYFVPGPRGVALAKQLRERGVKFRVLTNSLATTDAPAVHVGYSRYRKPLLEAGVELNELRRRVDAPRADIGSFGSSQASLHAKVVVIDRKTALVGSMNMDPRSEKLNSEMGVVIRSPDIAAQLARIYEEVSATSYRLRLDDEGDLHWISGSPEAADTTTEPEAGLWLRFGVKLLSPMAPDEML